MTIAALLVALNAASSAATSAAAPPDTIVITAERKPGRALPPVNSLDDAQLTERQPKSAADAVRALPGVSVRPNSRGETIARIRGSEERQAQVFLDGAPLAVPWDGRADIGVIPAGLIGAVSVTKGAVPIEYGANAVAGVIDLQTRTGGPAGIRASASAGTYGFAEGAGVATLPAGGVDVTVAAATLSRDAEPVASLAALPFSQPHSKRRLNTDLDSMSLFGAARFSRGPVAVRAALLRVAADRGIAPESDRDPAVSAPRYWRYPDIALTQAILASDVQLSPKTALRLVGWRQWFGQTINQYRNASYTTLRAREVDRDDTLGGRVVLSTTLAPVDLRLVANAQTSRHAQRDTAFPGALPGPRLIYRQNLVSLGAEADLPLGPGHATLGLAYDRSANPRTGDKPAQPARGALAASAAWRVPLSDRWTLIASAGRRNRFPSARELFGEALGRFLPNPDLKPEQAWLGDLALTYQSATVTAQLNPFVARTRDTIAQRIVTVDGRALRQRYNLKGSLSLGADAAITAKLSKHWSADLTATLLRARADANTATFRRLPRRPAYEFAGAATYTPTETLSLRAELRRYGPAVDLAPDGTKARLAPGNELNLRGRWTFARIGTGARIALTASIDNLTNDVVTPQLGLPLPGRSVRVGVQIN